MTKPDPFRSSEYLGRARYLHLGCGDHHLPRPWENFDSEIDLRRALPFPSESAEHIQAEHIIQRLPFAAALSFLVECRRVLEPNAVLRLSFPDVSRFDRTNSRI